MTRTEATEDDILMVIAEMANEEMTRLAQAIEERNAEAMTHLITTAYMPVILLKGLSRDFKLPGDWEMRADEVFNEYHRLRSLANRVRGFPE